MVARGDSNPGSFDCESGILPLSHRATDNGLIKRYKWYTRQVAVFTFARFIMVSRVSSTSN